MYNIAKVRSQGATDQQIAEYLSSQYGYDLKAVMQKGADYKQVADYLASIPPQKVASDYFQAQGWTKDQAAGIVGNLWHESGNMSPDAKQKGGSGWGLAQWTSPDRVKGLMEYAKSKDESTPSFKTQLEYVQKELGSDESQAGKALKGAKTVRQATEIFSGMFERPGKPEMRSRLEKASQVASGKLSTGQKIARAIIPYTKTIFPFAGSVVGGIAAAPANVIAPGAAEAAGVGLGGAAGIQAERALENYAGIKRPETQGEKMLGPAAGPWLDAAVDVGTMAAGGVIAPTLPGIEAVGGEIPGLQSIAKPLVAEGGEAALGRQELSHETGVPLTPAQIGQKKSSAYLEGQLRHNMWSSDTAQQFDQEQYAALQKYGRTVQDEIFGGKSDQLTAGEEAKSSAWKRYRAFQKDASRIYDSVPVKPDTPIETQNLASTAVEHIDQLGKMESSTIKRILGIAGKGEVPASVETSGIVDHLGRPIQTETPAKPAYTWQELRGDMSKLGKMVEETSDYNKKRIYRDLLDAANKDIGAFANKVDNPDVQKSLDLANKYYQYGERVFGPARDADHPGVRVWRENQIKNMMRTESPEDIGKTFFKANPNQSDIRRLKAAAGPEAFQEMKRSWLEDMLTSGENGSFSYNRFATAYDKYKRSGNLTVMLTKEEREGLDKLYDISKSVQWSERIGGNPSGSGKMILNTLHKFAAHPIYATMEAIGAKRLAENYFDNPEFQAKLIKGLELPAGSRRARVAADFLAKLAGAELRGNLR